MTKKAPSRQEDAKEPVGRQEPRERRLTRQLQMAMRDQTAWRTTNSQEGAEEQGGRRTTNRVSRNQEGSECQQGCLEDSRLILWVLKSIL